MLPVNLQRWIDKNRDQLQPPVGNKVLFDNQQTYIMAVGGPNLRKDYHVNQTPEIFYQVIGDAELILKLPADEKKLSPKDLLTETITIKQGEIFLLPANIPHSPQRAANTVGLVIEQSRRQIDYMGNDYYLKDALQWYCEECDTLLFEGLFELRDIENDFLPIISEFNKSDELRTCNQCNVKMPPYIRVGE